MANVQLEDGFLRVAFGLSAAIPQFGFTALEHDVLWVVMNLTYGANQTKAEISIDDIRYQIGERSNARTARLITTVEELVNKNVLFKQSINQHRFILGIQKDFDKWGAQTEKTAKMAHTISNIYNTNIHMESANLAAQTESAPLTPPQRLLGYVFGLAGIKPSISVHRIELSRAKRLYIEALNLTHSPTEAAYALKDYFDQLYTQEWVKANVKFPMGFALTRFSAYQKNIPRKPRDIKENEQLIGRRMRYNFSTKGWELTKDKLGGNNGK